MEVVEVVGATEVVVAATVVDVAAAVEVVTSGRSVVGALERSELHEAAASASVTPPTIRTLINAIAASVPPGV